MKTTKKMKVRTLTTVVKNLQNMNYCKLKEEMKV